ncbi:hypothetical protein [Microbacterium sp. NIBRBAC000506063]|uniref:hypothetical protein n=1 Tax=Microbacterium sp. NIBRBAC000506063 TaxID=2734618 RepID=UPI001BB49A54|nr:hypothetical protein [Microbacterium sp. NIBRBAC000506063]QTV80413.1 hypothetical protein KAE78_05660 [Microbacterium sp. NIBRBAC000506063]
MTLTLPTAYQTAGLDAALELSAGRLVAEGDFGRLDVEVNAGRADVTGSATRADVLVNAGRADVTLRDVAQARFDINAGRVEADLTGSAPDDVTIDVSAGELVLAVPNSVYDVRSNVSAGSFDNRLDTASTSSRTIDVQVSAGSATLRPGN